MSVVALAVQMQSTELPIVYAALSMTVSVKLVLGKQELCEMSSKSTDRLMEEHVRGTARLRSGASGIRPY